MWLVDKIKKLKRLRFFIERPYATRPVGSKFYYNGFLMRVVEGRNCGLCSLYSDTCRCYDNKDILGECSRKTRTDGTNVIFKYEDENLNKDHWLGVSDKHWYNAQFLIKKLWEFK